MKNKVKSTWKILIFYSIAITILTIIFICDKNIGNYNPYYIAGISNTYTQFSEAK